ncbi:MAG: beta-propeller fold lactonase family protein [Acidobacteriota bacterium]|nr:MAG: beta-propeller fold lactonase family protein [Acidobacteriota bacterium]
MLMKKVLLLLVTWSLLAAACAQTRKTEPEPVPLTEWKSGYRVYVTNETSGDMTVIDGATNEVIATVPLGKRPRGVHASPDGKTIYIALSGSPPAPPGVDESTLPPPDKSADGIGVFDVESNKLLRVIQGGSDPENFDVSLDGATIFVSNEDISAASFIDVASGKVTETIKVGEEPEGVKLSPDGKTVYVTCETDGEIAVIDVASRKLIKSFKVGRRPRNIVFLPDGKLGYVNAENDGTVVLFDAVRNVKLKEISLGEPGVIKPMGLVLAPDSKQLYTSTGRGRKVFVIDTATNQPVASFEAGTRPWGIGVSPDGKTIYTANGPSNDVSVIDLESKSVVKKIQAGDSPWGILIIDKGR